MLVPALFHGFQANLQVLETHLFFSRLCLESGCDDDDGAGEAVVVESEVTAEAGAGGTVTSLFGFVLWWEVGLPPIYTVYFNPVLSLAGSPLTPALGTARAGRMTRAISRVKVSAVMQLRAQDRWHLSLCALNWGSTKKTILKDSCQSDSALNTTTYRKNKSLCCLLWLLNVITRFSYNALKIWAT